VLGFRVLALCCIVFVVLNAILMSVFFNRFVIVLTFALWYVKVAHVSLFFGFRFLLLLFCLSLVLLLSVGDYGCCRL
jgi:hypothetical protein